MDMETEKLFADFRQKNTLEYIDSMQQEIYQYLPNKVIRMTNMTTDTSCHLCKKKAVYVVTSSKQHVCWKHGMEINKNIDN